MNKEKKNAYHVYELSLSAPPCWQLLFNVYFHNLVMKTKVLILFQVSVAKSEEVL